MAEPRPRDRKARLKQTERNLAEAKRKNTGIRPDGRPDPAKQRRPDMPGQTIVNSDQTGG